MEQQAGSSNGARSRQQWSKKKKKRRRRRRRRNRAKKKVAKWEEKFTKFSRQKTKQKKTQKIMIFSKFSSHFVSKKGHKQSPGLLSVKLKSINKFDLVISFIFILFYFFLLFFSFFLLPAPSFRHCC